MTQVLLIFHCRKNKRMEREHRQKSYEHY